MTLVQERLIGIVESISAATKQETLGVEFEATVSRLEELIEPAVAEESDATRYLISLMNLLLELRRETIPRPALETFFSQVEKSLDRPPAVVDSLLQGNEAHPEASPEIRVGCTMMRWRDFTRYFAPHYGAEKSLSELERLWGRIQMGELLAPQQDLHLSSAGVVWITDEETLHTHCASPSPGEIDGTRAYDALGLDWLTGWDYGQPIPEARAVILAAPVFSRRSADRGLRVPTSIDAWGGFGFVPKQGALPRTWPSNAGASVDPNSGNEHLPEAVHGPVSVASGADCPVRSCSPVLKAVPDRVDECGRMVWVRLFSNWPNPLIYNGFFHLTARYSAWYRSIS